MVQVGEGFRFRTEIVLDSESIVSTNHSNHLQHSVRNAPGNTLRCTDDGEIKLIRLEFAAHSRHQNNGRAIGNCRGNRQSATESRQKRWPGLFFLLPAQNCQVVQVDGASRWDPGSNYLDRAPPPPPGCRLPIGRQSPPPVMDFHPARKLMEMEDR